jgi:hypothetical protein
MGPAATRRRDGHQGGALSGRGAEVREERHPPGADVERDPEREHDAREEGERDQEDGGRRELDYDDERELETEEGNPT